MAKRSSGKTIRTDYGISIDFDESGKVKKIDVIDANAEDKDSINSNLQTLMAAHGLGGRSSQSIVQTPTIDRASAAILADSKLKPTTRKQYGAVFGHFANHFGADTPLAKISQDRFAEYADVVCSHPKWSAKTKSIYITAAQRLFGFYEARNGGVPRISTKGLKPKRTQPAGHDREGFTLQETQVLFQNAAKYRETAPHKWWITVACAFLGCRIEELAQAHLGRDIARDETTGFWFFRIDELAADDAATKGNLQKSVKTFAAWRLVPIHPVLVETGFIDYLNSEADAGAKTPFGRHWKPFHDKKTRGVKYSHSGVKWGMNELNKLRRQKLIIRDGLTYFHSMRHTFTTLLAAADIGEEWRAALAGHSYGGMNAQVYNKAKHDLAKTSPIVVRGLERLATVLRQVVSDAKGK